jgi:chaperonin cofactor prefoldin
MSKQQQQQQQTQSSIHTFKNVETIPPPNTNAGFRLLNTITEEDYDNNIQYVSGNVFVPPSKIEYESFQDNEEEWKESRSTMLLRQQLNIGWYNDDDDVDDGGETTMAAKLHDTDHEASGETKVTSGGYLIKWEDILVGLLDKFSCGGSGDNDEHCSNNDPVGFGVDSQWRLVLREEH